MDSSSGVSAERPTQFGSRAWRQVIRRTVGEVGNDHLSMISAGVAFQFFLALFPAIAAAVSIYGMVANPGDVQQAVESTRGILPSQVIDLMGQQMSKIAATSGSALGIGAVIGIVVALWSANSGTKSLIEALDIAYNEHEKRGFLKLNAVSLLLTVGAILGLVVAVGSVVVLPALLGKLPLPQSVQTIVAWSRWPILFVAMMIALAFLYRFAPSRQEARWQWVSPGALTATILWLIASGIFSFYVSHSGSYNATYGSLAAIVILLMWFYISAFVVLFGAEMNSESERQTERDTTTGEPEPLGRRAAWSADTVAAQEYRGGHRDDGHRERRPARPPRPLHPRHGDGVAAMESDLDATRGRMEETLRALRGRAKPEDMVGRAGREISARLERTGAATRQNRPVLLGAVGLVAGALLASALPKRTNPTMRGRSEPPR